MATAIVGSPVLTCHEKACGYNSHECCYAPAIEVGDEHPRCDTFTRGKAMGLTGEMPAVAACHVEGCSFNRSMSCGAPGVTLGGTSATRTA